MMEAQAELMKATLDKVHEVLAKPKQSESEDVQPRSVHDDTLIGTLPDGHAIHLRDLSPDARQIFDAGLKAREDRLL